MEDDCFVLGTIFLLTSSESCSILYGRLKKEPLMSTNDLLIVFGPLIVMALGMALGLVIYTIREVR